MKKPHVLNRAMFNRGGTSAYGRGITSNLVSDEQRQRFNFGGRVGLYHGGNQRTVGGYYARPWETRMDMRSEYNAPYTSSYGGTKHENIRGADLSNFVRKNPKFGHLEYANAFLPSQLYSPTSSEGEDYRDITDMPGFRKLYQDYQDPETLLIDPDKIDVKTGLPIEEAPDDSFIEKEKEEVISKGPMGDEMWDETIVRKEPDEPIRKDTDELDTEDKWAFLDEQQKAKQKLARGYGLTEAAAAAAKWSTAGTAKERSAAISEGLSKVGKIGAKYKGEAEDIKTKAKILGTVEEIKGEQKRKEWELKMKEWYTPSLEQAKEAQEWKEGRAIIADELAKDKSGKEIYARILLPKEIRSAQDQQKAILSLTDQRLTIEDNKNSKELRDPGKNGLVFITKLGEIVKNNNGSIDPINPLTDPFFTWK